MTLDEARFADGFSKGRTETVKEKRKDLIDALHSEGESKERINRLLNKTHNQPLTDEEIKELGL